MTTQSGDRGVTIHVVRFPEPLDLAAVCAPVAWARGRWPNEEWANARFWWVGRERGRVIQRVVAPHPDGIAVTGDGNAADAESWARRVFAPAPVEILTDDDVLARLAVNRRGWAALCYGSLFEGAVMSVVGQSISVAAAAVTATRLSALFHPGVEASGRILRPLPSPEELADASATLLRTSGVTTRRAETLVQLGCAFADGSLPDRPVGPGAIQEASARLLAMPGIGPWTVASALLWGIGEPDAFPVGDAAVLRAARAAYDDGAMTHRDLERRAESWRPRRAVAARLLWLDMFGPAPAEG